MRSPINIYTLPNSIYGVQAGENTLLLTEDEMYALQRDVSDFVYKLTHFELELGGDSIYNIAEVWDD
jgi:hypothetical protein